MSQHQSTATGLDASQSQLLLIDVQERILPAMQDVDSLCSALELLTHGATTLSVPCSVSEHCADKLGPTYSGVAGLLGRDDFLHKRSFSAMGADPLRERVCEQARERRDTVVIAGIEAHVCVTLTALDCLAEGLHVVVAVDATASRCDEDRHTALQTLARRGALLIPVETLLFAWMGSADHKHFRDLSRLTRDRVQRAA